MSLVSILDADKEGFLRSTRSLIQTIGRAARNVSGEVHMYADTVTDSMRAALDETSRRRQKQIDYNLEHGIDPQPLRKKIADVTDMLVREQIDTEELLAGGYRKTPRSAQTGHVRSDVPTAEAELVDLIDSLTQQMHSAASELNFELAARIRDELADLKQELRGMRQSR